MSETQSDVITNTTTTPTISIQSNKQKDKCKDNNNELINQPTPPSSVTSTPITTLTSSMTTNSNHLNSNGHLVNHYQNGYSVSRKQSNDQDQSINDRAETLKAEINDLRSHLMSFLTDVASNPQSTKVDPITEWNTIATVHDESLDKTRKKSDIINERVFVKRNSLLTDLFKITHVRTIRHIFIIIMVVLILQVFASDKLERGQIDLNFDLVKWCFGKSNIVFFTWLYMKLSAAFIVYYCFYHWSTNRRAYVTKKSSKINMYDICALTFSLIYYLIFLIAPAYVVISNELPIASSMIITMEQLRLIMKSYAFVRSNIPRALECTYLPEKDKESSSDIDENSPDNAYFYPCPNFSCYMYFLFAPTLVYRDSYPRNSRVHWNHVFTNFAQVVGGILYTYYLFQRFCIPVFQHFNTENVTLKMFVESILNCALPGSLLLLIAFYSFLHCWLNAFAEMLRFADRMFYKDWWNSTSFSNYYRTWNGVVHDWLYNYIYKDVMMLFGKRYKSVAQFVIFFISAIFHEYVLTLSFGFFYPLLAVMFGAIGFLFMFHKPKKHSNFWNIVLWIALTIGLGCLMCLYSIEWYARKNCPKPFESTILNYLIPRSFTCLRKNTNFESNNFDKLIKSEL